MQGPLHGVRVIDLTIWVQGPLAGQVLADLGADVIKIEKPGQGDFTRGLQTLYGASMRTADGKALLWELVNRNKRSVGLDLRVAEGQALLHRLVEDADVFVTNLLPSTLERFGASEEKLTSVNPRLVYAHGGGLATSGPLADTPSQDTTGTAYSGFMYSVSRDGEPHYPSGALADLLSGTNLAFAITAALLRREKTGHGEVVSTSLIQGMLWLQQLHVGAIMNTGDELRPFDPMLAPNALLNLYRCGDGEWLALGMTAMSGEDWAAFCEVIARPELKDDPRFRDNRGRIMNAQELIEQVGEALAMRPRDEWLGRIPGTGLTCAPVRRLKEVLADPDVADALLTRTHSGMTYVRAPFNIGGVPETSGDAPAYGADTFNVLAELGLTPEEIAKLQQAEIAW
jgi:crotonobetainyl-CoA:carnitine CoA-transferase CaiB-like acyl-CoA transferase